MAIIPIRIVPDPVLRQRAKRVTAFNPPLHKLIDDMVETLRDAHGIGLAANQVGVLLRVVVIEIPCLNDEECEMTELYELVNPQILRRFGERVVEEGCLSIPGYRGELMRSERVSAKAQDRWGKDLRLKVEGLLAQAVEHETDHLNGILYTDHLESHEKLHRVLEDSGQNMGSHVSSVHSGSGDTEG